MDGKLLLSICIPCRVQADNDMFGYCQKCLDSIQNNREAKDWKDKFEVIVVDDESSDDSLKSLKVSEGINFTLVRNERRRGIGGARNVALGIAKGKYVHYMDADDVVADDYLKTLLKHIEEDAEKDIQLYLLSFVTKFVGADGKERTSANPMKMGDYAECPVSSCCKVVRRDKAVLHKEEVYIEDVDYNFRLLDGIGGKENVRILNDIAYWCYDNTRPTAYTRTANFLSSNRYTLEQISTQNILVKKNLKDRAVSDLLRVCAELYDLRNTFSHANVKLACLTRLNYIWNKVLTNNYTH